MSSTRKKAKKEAKPSEGDSNLKEPKIPSASSVGPKRTAPTNTDGDAKRARVVSSTNTGGPRKVWEVNSEDEEM